MTVYQIGPKRWRAQYARQSIGVFPTKAAAKKAEAEFIARRTGAAEDLTVAEWRERWLKHVEARCKPSTVATYRSNTAKFARAHGDRKLTSWTRADAADWAAAHPATVAGCGQMFRAAVDLDLIPDDPFARAPRPKYRRKLEPGWFTAEDLAELERIALGDGDEFGVQLSAMVTVAAWTAIRPGELWALTPADVDGARLHIRASKTEAGVRTVVLPRPARDAITRASRASEYLHPGRLSESGATVFANTRGDKWRTSSFQWHWNTIRTAFGRPNFQIYELRHFGITRLIEAGVDYVDIAVQVGHSNTRQIERVYGHPNLEHARKRVEAGMQRLQAAG